MSEAAGVARMRRALWGSLSLFGIISVVVIGVLIWQSRLGPETIEIAEHEVPGPRASATEPLAPPALPFTDITRASGIDFLHETGAYGDRLLPETMGGGVAFFDYDNDGDPDLLLINSNHWPWRQDTSLGQDPHEPPTTHLYRNRGDGVFEDVSSEVGLDLSLYGMGVAVGDYDGDGFIDIFITAVGENRLLHNEAGVRFTDTTLEAGVAGAADAWSTSAAFFDYDRDGDLDLFVCNYVAWTPEIDREVDYTLTGIGRAYGPPTDFAGTHSYLYRNDSGRFVDVSATAGIRVAHETGGGAVGKALAVHPVDVNGDGWLDIAVANDTVRNFLFLNQTDGSFREAGIESGFAFDSAGLATGAMGIDAAYFANDGRLAIAIGNFANEMTSFYTAQSAGDTFSDDAIVTGIGAASRRALTFGLLFLDVDLDGRLDLLAANGHVEPEIHRVQSSQQYAQPPQMFWNCGERCTRRYLVISEPAGDLRASRVARGAAYADIDGDGDLDLLITAVGGRPVLLRNDQTLDHHWVRLRLRSDLPNTHAIGATVTLIASGTNQVRAVMPARSYLSQVELPLTFGLGEARRVETVIVRWPDGEEESWTDLAVDTTHDLRRGQGEPPSSPPSATEQAVSEQIAPPLEAALERTVPEVGELLSGFLAKARDNPESGSSRGELGMAYEANGFPDAAFTSYQQAEALDENAATPDNKDPRWPYFQALILAGRGDQQLALQALNRSIAIDESYAPAWLWRGTWSLDLGLPDDAMDAFVKADALGAGSSAVVGQALVGLHKRQPETAIVLLEPLSRQIRHPNIFQLLGRAYREADRPTDARAALAQVQSAEQLGWEDAWHENKRSFEGSFNALASNAYDLLSRGEPAQALEILESLIRQQPDNKDVINDLSFAYASLGEEEKAFHILHNALEIHPDYYLFHYNISDIYDWRGDLETALVHVNQAITLNPAAAAPYTRKGLLLIKQGRYEDALSEFESALLYDESDPQIFFYAGQMAATLKRWSDAIRRFEAAVQIDPAFALGHINLAGSLAYSYRFDEARTALQRAEQLGTHVRQVQNAFRHLAEQEAGSK